MQDADIALIARTLEPHTSVELAEAVGRPVDLIGLHTAGEPVLCQILKHGIRVQGKADAHGRLLSRHLIDAPDFRPYAQRMVEEWRRASLAPGRNQRMWWCRVQAEPHPPRRGSDIVAPLLPSGTASWRSSRGACRPLSTQTSLWRLFG